jgi:hypothetical protein
VTLGRLHKLAVPGSPHSSSREVVVLASQVPVRITNQNVPGGGGWAQVIEHFPIKLEALSSNPSKYGLVNVRHFYPE